MDKQRDNNGTKSTKRAREARADEEWNRNLSKHDHLFVKQTDKALDEARTKWILKHGDQALLHETLDDDLEDLERFTKWNKRAIANVEAASATTSSNQRRKAHTFTPTRPTPTRPAPTRSAPTRPTPTRPAPTRSASTRPTPTRPASTRPASTRPASTRPASTTPSKHKYAHQYASNNQQRKDRREYLRTHDPPMYQKFIEGERLRKQRARDRMTDIQKEAQRLRERKHAQEVRARVTDVKKEAKLIRDQNAQAQMTDVEKEAMLNRKSTRIKSSKARTRLDLDKLTESSTRRPRNTTRVPRNYV